jgi:hypothetical protein
MDISRRTIQKSLKSNKKKIRKMDGNNPKDIRQTLNLVHVERGKTQSPPHPERKIRKKKKKNLN